MCIRDSSEAPLELSFFSQIQDSLREKRELFFEKRVPQQPACIRNDLPVIDQIEEKDWFLSFPYESMKPFIRLLKEAGEDERVVSLSLIHILIIDLLCSVGGKLISTFVKFALGSGFLYESLC